MATADSDFKFGESWIHLAPIFPISPEIQPDLAKSFQQSFRFLAYPQFSPAPHIDRPQIIIDLLRSPISPEISSQIPSGAYSDPTAATRLVKLRLMVSFVSEQRDPTTGDHCKRPKRGIATACDFKFSDSRIPLAKKAGCKSGIPQRETPTGDHSGSPQRGTTVEA